MKPLTQGDLQFVVARIPKDLREVMMKNRLFIGGGFIRETIAGGDIKDIDVFGDSIQALNTIAEYMTLQREGRMHRSMNALTVLKPPRLPLQFILRWCYDDAEKLVASFDFTICQAAIWFQNHRWQSLVNDAFYPDLAARRLVYTFPVREEAAGGSMLRVRKFLQRGYNIQAASLAGVISRLAVVREVQNATGEQAKAVAISGLLHEVDPMVVIDGLDLVDEHEVVA